MCPQCGQLRSVCADPTRTWSPHEHVCYATVNRVMAIRKTTRQHEKTQPDADGFHPLDGVLTWVSPDEMVPVGDEMG